MYTFYKTLTTGELCLSVLYAQRRPDYKKWCNYIFPFE